MAPHYRFAQFAVFIFLSLFSGVQLIYGQLFEDFEQGSKGSYAPGIVNLESGSWMFNDALIGNREGDLYIW